ncbi:MAG TPA: hypothetical protein VET26_07545, partial [Candidatus Sulfotelmatobacter sp.]|nr:hypothetical protein [Candidatus Sulfotelmatobacter sp.]
MPDLEQELNALAPAIDWPATPHLAARVASSLGISVRPSPRWFSRRLAVAAAAVLVAGAALFAYSPSRDAIAGWLNLHAIIERVQNPPSPSPLPPGPLGKRLGLGNPTTLDAARAGTEWAIALPSAL